MAGRGWRTPSRRRGTTGLAPLPSTAKPFQLTPDTGGRDNPVGVLVLHGITGTPHSVRAWGEYLGAAGLAVSCPLLPGHGTRWQDLAATGWRDWYRAADDAFAELHARCSSVFVMGLSMGATLALRLAEEHGVQVAGVVTVNPTLGTDRRGTSLIPYVATVLPSVGASPAGGRLWGPKYSDIKAPGTQDIGYDRFSLRAFASLRQLWAVTLPDLHRIVCPVLTFRSVTDHVVEPSSGRRLLAGVTHAPITEQLLHDSYHVATLDNDKERIFAGSLRFVRRPPTASASVPAAVPATPDSDGSPDRPATNRLL
ncbi:alpha/beta fold hydrolase [Frankia sp. AgB1.9]|uniref:alpha/beta hydrolase n=1 Tax=unclassified Frankia TaxID=2632575 RepID=UPI00193220EE|nr:MULTISPECIES: alpha/beta fold hydrolase [unclassified Frankia]MBL7492546.1 alpha/beta fold hydrolase [Frankia sp. AgW1.1]MBL7546701.1 alpha/beta fold hydrolase [Frankia sp. AgB1.9]MBL7622859.1 alpha/beta fold hydrolase [Frankia sp. AgB1.8]